MNENLLIVFVKNSRLGKVKTRLAKSIGDNAAFEVYTHLVEITERETAKLENCDVHIYFSESLVENQWPGKTKFVQQGEDLGQRMRNAFSNSFAAGYKHVLGVGSDLPDLNASIISKGFLALTQFSTVFGPADDGGYYLIGMNSLQNCIFENKPWSTENLLELTKTELQQNDITVCLLETLNDIDTIEDLQQSSIAHKFVHLFQD